MSLATTRKITLFAADKSEIASITVSVPAKKLTDMPAILRAALADLCVTHGARVVSASMTDPSNRLGKSYALNLPAPTV